jgi:hypothetical protein
MADTVVIAEQGEGNTSYRFSWSLAFAGAAVATAVTFFLLSLGAGFGLLLVQPTLASVPSFLTGGAIYFFAAQAFGFAAGGHLAGRLIGPLAESRVQEEFRAAAHGFVTWATTVVATLIVVALAGMAANAGSGTAALYGAAMPKSAEPASSAYLVDVLFRPNAAPNEAARAQAGRILQASLARGEEITPSDREQLKLLVSREAGISRDGAAERIDRLQTAMQAKTKRAADIARKTASYASLWIAFSLLFGAVVSTLAAVMARNEDDREAFGFRRR